jgi:hypothetical protein
MPLDWDDRDAWVLLTEQPAFGCAPPYVANGRVGLRLGAFILGTDVEAPRLPGAGPEHCLFAVPRFDHSWPLQSFAAHGRDGFLHCLPSWGQLKLRTPRYEFRPGKAITGSRCPLTTWLDLRTGEAGLDGHWMTEGGPVTVRIRLLAPRSCSHGAFWELELDGLPVGSELEFGLEGEHLARDVEQAYERAGSAVQATVRTHGRKRELALGLRWDGEGFDVAGVECSSTRGWVRLKSTGSRLRLRVLYACRGGVEAGGKKEAARDLEFLDRGLADGSLRKENERLWRELWARGLDVTALPMNAVDQKFLLAQQFYLLASYDTSDLLTPVIGLSGNQWLGAQLWDNDLWQGYALAIFWPELARRIVRSRLKMLPGARALAREHGYRGAQFAWMSDEEGLELSPNSPYQQEIHINAWAMLLVWNLWLTTGDRAVLEEGWPILSEVAEFWCSRAERAGDGSWHLRGVLGPDEAVHENPKNPQLIDDNFATNVAVQAALRAACAAAKLLGKEAPALWGEVAERLFIQRPGKDGVIPEYTGYAGHDIKQADTILAFFPLDFPATPEQVRANLDYYHERVTSGPLMTETIEAAIRLRLGREEKKKVLVELLRVYRRCVHGAFEVPYEVACNSNSLMLTACGGLLAALACGWWSYRKPGDDARNIPRLECK